TACERTNSTIAEGTVLINVTCCDAGCVARWSTSSPRITAPPQESGAKISNTERSKQIEVDAKTPASSSLENVFSAHWRKLITERCSIATPFGCPVEPDV